MSRILTTAAAALAGALLLAGCGGGAGEQATGLAGFIRDPVPQVDGVSLPDVGPVGKGKPVPMRARPGNLLVVYFGFASCPDICPTTLSDVRGALKRLPADQRKRVEVAMVTVDPKRDTAKVMRSYVGHFFDSWRAYRTNDAAALAGAEKAFGASHSITPAKGGGYDVVHSAFTYVVDDQGRLRVEWPFAMPRRDISQDLATILEEDTNT